MLASEFLLSLDPDPRIEMAKRVFAGRASLGLWLRWRLGLGPPRWLREFCEIAAEYQENRRRWPLPWETQ